jgi:Lrp/AsnC family transcriptional regulator, leucine-responsive regulatory protein
MESLDRKILMLLAEDSERSLQELATELEVPTSTLHQKIKRLETKGLIKGYRASIDVRKAGLKMTSFVSLTPLDPAAPDDIPQRLSDIQEIEGCWSVAGEESYIVKVHVSEPADLEALLAKIRQVANVSTQTTVVLSTAFENRPPAIPSSGDTGSN